MPNFPEYSPQQWEKIVGYKEQISCCLDHCPKFLSNMSFLLYFTIATLTTHLVFSKPIVNNSGLSSAFKKLESDEDHQLTKIHFDKYERYANDFIGMLF